MSYINIGHTYFRTDGQVMDLGFGKEVWYGMFSSVRPNSWTEAGTQYLATLNVNIVMKVGKFILYNNLRLMCISDLLTFAILAASNQRDELDFQEARW